MDRFTLDEATAIRQAAVDEKSYHARRAAAASRS
jgi:hypothetical protein